jgi:hypothetical protein
MQSDLAAAQQTVSRLGWVPTLGVGASEVVSALLRKDAGEAAIFLVDQSTLLKRVRGRATLEGLIVEALNAKLSTCILQRREPKVIPRGRPIWAGIPQFDQHTTEPFTISSWYASPEELDERIADFLRHVAERLDAARDALLASPPDPLLVAWRLVVDFKAEPDLLRHLDPTKLWQAVAKYEGGMDHPKVAAAKPGGTSIAVGGDRGSWQERLTRIQAALGATQTASPSPLWLAWMRTVHGAGVEALKQPPLDPGGDGPALESAGLKAAAKTGPGPSEKPGPSKTDSRPA